MHSQRKRLKAYCHELNGSLLELKKTNPPAFTTLDAFLIAFAHFGQECLQSGPGNKGNRVPPFGAYRKTRGGETMYTLLWDNGKKVVGTALHRGIWLSHNDIDARRAVQSLVGRRKNIGAEDMHVPEVNHKPWAMNRPLPVYDDQYEDLLADILLQGTYKQDRTGTGTVSVFGRQMRFNLRDGFPLVTTKSVHMKSVIVELLWFLRGEGNVNFLHQHNVTIWDEWQKPNGELGPVYGVQWRKWEDRRVVEAGQADVLAGKGYETEATDESKQTVTMVRHIDQIKDVIETLKKNPDSRRVLVTAWNPSHLGDMALPPCHSFFQFYVENGRLSCQLYQRSVDACLGLPFNIASYALLTHMVAQQVGLDVGDFVWTGGDCHIYSNHIEPPEGYDSVMDQIHRPIHAMPLLKIRRKPETIDDYCLEDFEVVDYEHGAKLRYPVAV